MKIQETQTKKLTITDVQGMDAIAVYLEDHAPGIGKITITCYGAAWSSFWAHMGEKYTISTFFRKASNCYLIGNLSPQLESTEIDESGIYNFLKKTVCHQRRRQDLQAEQAREIWEEIIEAIDFTEPMEFVKYGDGNEIMYTLFGDEWWYDLPHRTNPAYERLSKIIDVIKTALSQLDDERGCA